MKMRTVVSIWLLVFLTGASVTRVLASPCYSLRRMAALEKRVARYLRSERPAEAKEPLRELAKGYRDAKRYQEAIWTLKRLGKRAEARKLEDRLERILAASPLGEGRPLPAENDNPMRHELPEGVSAIVKSSEDSTNVRAEAAAYALDKLLELNIVPATVLRREGKNLLSVQYFVRNLRQSEEHLRYDFRRYDVASPEFVKPLYLLDYLLNNRDRNGNNWLFRSGHVLVAIDHGEAKPGAAEPTHRRWPHLVPDGAIRERFLKVTDQEIRTALKPSLSAREIQAVLSRWHALKADLVSVGQ